MATVNFSVPDDVKEAFNQEFADENKSAIIASLMQQAVEERRKASRRARAIELLLRQRSKLEPISEADLAAARHEGRQ